MVLNNIVSSMIARRPSHVQNQLTSDLSSDEDENGNGGADEATGIILGRKKVCPRCNISIRRRMDSQFSISREGFPDPYMFPVVMNCEEDLCQEASLGKTVMAKVLYDEYCSIFLNRTRLYSTVDSGDRVEPASRLESGSPKSFRNFIR